jgi:hypothetical protein
MLFLADGTARMFRQRTTLRSEGLVVTAVHSMIEKRNGCNLATRKPRKIYSRAAGIIDVLPCMDTAAAYEEQCSSLLRTIGPLIVSSLLVAVSIMSCHELGGCT